MRLVVISSNGSPPFAIKLKQVGGLKQLARTPYMRNLWAIMTKFNTLPTDPTFRELSDSQIDLLIYSMVEDRREQDLASRGLTADGDYYDTSFDDEVWNRDVGEWDVLKEGHDPNDIARQVEELTKEADRRNLASKFDNLDEYNKFREAGGETARESEVSQHIERQLRLAQEKAKMLEATSSKKKDFVDDSTIPEVQDKSNAQDQISKLDKQVMENAISLFNGNSEDDDEDFTML
jgi:hypothetical protein